MHEPRVCNSPDWTESRLDNPDADDEPNLLTLMRLEHNRARGRHLVETGPVSTFFNTKVQLILQTIQTEAQEKLLLNEYEPTSNTYITYNQCVVSTDPLHVLLYCMRY